MLALFLTATASIGHANTPFDTTTGDHVAFLEHKFYDIYFFPHNETVLDALKLINNADAIVQSTTSSVDDVPEIRIDLPWDFTFYGHRHDWINLSPNGFATTHPINPCGSFCNWWTDGQNYRRYIAPMMADFNLNASAESRVLYLIDNATQSLSVQWSNVSLWQPNNTEAITFRWDFQLTIAADGTIHFYYFEVPALPNTVELPQTQSDIDDDITPRNYSLHIGLEDAAYQHIGLGSYYIYPYEPVDIAAHHVLARHVVVFKPRETCIDQMSCSDCMTMATDLGSTLECGWCPELAVCSDGMGREIFEYASDDFCTDNDMVHHDDLTEEMCVELTVEMRWCGENDHVLARNPSITESERYYSGVIIDVDVTNSAYVIMYEDPALEAQSVSYLLTHPCSIVSFDYSSLDLPPFCTPHCAIPDETSPSSASPAPTASPSLRRAWSPVATVVIVILCVSVV